MEQRNRCTVADRQGMAEHKEHNLDAAEHNLDAAEHSPDAAEHSPDRQVRNPGATRLRSRHKDLGRMLSRSEGVRA